MTVTWRCGVCDEEHPTSAHALSPGVRNLDADQLRELRARTAEEILAAVRAGAEVETLRRFVALADALDVRLADVNRRDGATLARRQRIASEAAAGR